MVKTILLRTRLILVKWQCSLSTTSFTIKAGWIIELPFTVIPSPFILLTPHASYNSCAPRWVAKFVLPTTKRQPMPETEEAWRHLYYAVTWPPTWRGSQVQFVENSPHVIDRDVYTWRELIGRGKKSARLQIGCHGNRVHTIAFRGTTPGKCG